MLLLFVVGLFYGLYGLTQQAAHLRTEIENQRFARKTKANDRNLKNSTIASRRSKTLRENLPRNREWLKTNRLCLAPVVQRCLSTKWLSRPWKAKMSRLEEDMRAYEAVLRERGYTPTVWPVDGKLESGFGGRRNPFGGGGYEFHSGQDIDAPWGAPVVAGASGKVTFVGWQNGYGQLVVIDHGGGLTTRYGHLSHIDVDSGANVSSGRNSLGKVGSTGRSTGPHLHYEVRINDEPVNPLQYLLTSSQVGWSN